MTANSVQVLSTYLLLGGELQDLANANNLSMSEIWEVNELLGGLQVDP